MNEAKFTVKENVLTVERTFNAPIKLVWRAWTEAELLDQWWAPTPWKSETAKMDFSEGGSRLYAMVGPEGEKHWGLTEFTSIKPVTHFSGQDVFCDENGEPNREMPVAKFSNDFNENNNQTTVIMVTHYASADDLKTVIEMGMKEGLTMALNQLEDILLTQKV
ncbi:SRPBCC domain-containing protein [Paracrocinitomix mangrovi]|uniref:SRPBCC family protein n=1 Tax=Paracrocinitomix mangrovi TaxID=2862509 RepID=UPI001C8EC6B0|nr:SRPBCC domain-containing protein [Paracrocinitomix mangrovi]UKN01208.1 SRPBCC domain-containing protein [Paracrocinitomix mangrovi]